MSLRDLATRRARVQFDPSLGNLPLLEMDGAPVLHAAPWRDAAEVQADRAIPLVDRRLSGDFLCMPFGRDDVHGGPPHGLTANSRWVVKRHTPEVLAARLAMNVQGARVDKHLALDPEAPVLYQTHVIRGGQGAMTLAHHPMIAMAAGGRLRCSPKRAVLTEPTPQHPGAHFWALNQRVAGYEVHSVSGARVDIRDYPSEICEDFAVMIEAMTRGLGWSALERFAEDDTILILKDARKLPLTLLWVSNGGRDFSPWNGRHRGVLGIEDAICAGGAGFAAACRPNRITAEGVPSALDLGAGPHVIRHAILRLPRRVAVASVQVTQHGLVVAAEGGEATHTPFDPGFFA